MDSFAENLRKRAEQLGLANAEVARRAGLSERRYGNYVSGRREPDLATLVRIASTLKTSPNELLAFEKSKGKPSADSILQDRIQSACSSLSRADQETLVVIATALAERKR